MKLHLGCGSIYLKDYINVDASVDKFASDCSEVELEPHLTTFDRYYRYGFCEGPNGVVADVEANITDRLPFSSDTASEVILIQVLEHIPLYERDKVISEIYRVLKPGGEFIVGVPDIKETARLLGESRVEDEEWYIRLIHGTQRNKYSHHYCGYTKCTLKNYLENFGFTKFQELPNINFYPAIYLKATKEV